MIPVARPARCRPRRSAPDTASGRLRPGCWDLPPVVEGSDPRQQLQLLALEVHLADHSLVAKLVQLPQAFEGVLGRPVVWRLFLASRDRVVMGPVGDCRTPPSLGPAPAVRIEGLPT